MNRFLPSALAVSAAVAFAAGCSVGAEETGASNDAVTAGASCPVYSPPLCAADEHIEIQKDDQGCSVPVCRSCPEYDAPVCAAGKHLEITKDADGCSVPTCKSCPIYSPPFCAADETMVVEKDQNGCAVPKCEPR